MQDDDNFILVVQKPELNLISQVDQATKKVVSQNRENLVPILSIIFYYTHDIALREKTVQKGIYVVSWISEFNLTIKS